MKQQFNGQRWFNIDIRCMCHREKEQVVVGEEDILSYSIHIFVIVNTFKHDCKSHVTAVLQCSFIW